MRSKLLSSFIFVSFFWWTVTTLWWSLSDPELNRQALVALAHTFWFLHLTVPDHVSILDAFSIQRQVLMYWTLPIAVAVGLFAGIGQALVWMGAKKKADERALREKAGAEYRGINITLGALPRPASAKMDVLELSTDDVDKLDTLTEKEKALLLQILGVLSANPKAYAGEGHSVTILELAVAAVEQALSHKTRPGLAAIVAAANELGKITAYTKDGGGNWLLVKSLCRESATQLATLPGWWALPLDDRMAVSFAVRFNDSPDTLIDAGGNKSVLNLAKSLLYKAAAATEKASTEERERVLAKQELPDLALKVFLDNLNQIPFQDGLPKGVQAFGWKIGSRVFLLEIKLRESLLTKLPEDVRGALSAKEKRGLHPFTIELMKAFNAKGWLVKEHNGVKVTAREALWNIQAGKLPYKGVIVLDIPPDYREMLPSKESIYKVDITGPLFSNAGGSSMSANDMASMGLVGGNGNGERKPRPATDSTTQPKTPTAEDVAAVKAENDADLALAGLKPAARAKGPSDVVVKTVNPARNEFRAPAKATTPVVSPRTEFALEAAQAATAAPTEQPSRDRVVSPAPAMEVDASAPAPASSLPETPALKTAGISAAQRAKNEMLDLLREPAREVRLSAKDAARQSQKSPGKPSSGREADPAFKKVPTSARREGEANKPATKEVSPETQEQKS
jgi:hypothetical protein